ncbi:MAG: DUF3679 domain-containing protein [Clostridia bacterium]|nr:DUF3679 domain-containing protein [Clostridia bacterium]
MKKWKLIQLHLFVMIVMFAVCWGVSEADRGSKKVGGYLEDNVLLSVTADEDYYRITLLNREFTLRRF